MDNRKLPLLRHWTRYSSCTKRRCRHVTCSFAHTELPFLTGGYGVDRKIVAYNFFVIIGPASDPAGINGMSNVSLARKIYNCTQLSNPQYNPNVCGLKRCIRNSNQGNFTLDQCKLHLQSTRTQTSWFKVTGAGMGPTSSELLWQHRRIHNF